ncbi:sensor histidine kinase [Thiococcus pfennigii]|uniref:sensor histidine kinase n=1 Tax=Thiococcus pfennigii TaxID=1057 RepID=UPI001A911DAE|nr:ATP-binding protein [Thiococcus pfennigii]
MEIEGLLHRLERGAQEQNLLVTEMLLYPGERVEAQWRAKHRRLAGELGQEGPLPGGDEIGCCRSLAAAALLAHLRHDNTGLAELVERLIGLGPAREDGRDETLLRARYLSQILARSRSVIASLHELSETERRQVSARLRAANRLVLIVDVVVLVAAALLLVLLGRGLLRPMAELQRGFKRVGAGDLAHRVDSGRRDELGDLARGFDRMTGQVAEQTRRLHSSEASLAAANRDLEAKVAERTASLDEANHQLENAVRQLYSAGEELAQSERLATVGRLAAGITHELNNPLMGALNYCQYVRSQLEDGPLADWLGKAEQAIDRAARVSDRLFTFGQIGTDERRVLALPEVVEGSLKLASAAIERLGVSIEQHLPDSLPMVTGQPDALRQALLALLINACDAMAKSSERRIRISAGVNRDRLQLLVEDTGPGIPVEDRIHIFAPFFTTKPAGLGTGLGLTIARRLLEGMGGSLELATDVNLQPTWHDGAIEARPAFAGARFVLTLLPATEELPESAGASRPTPVCDAD